MNKRKTCLSLIAAIFLLVVLNFNNRVFAAETERIAGSDRYATSIQISKINWTTAENAFLASGEDFPDALSATPLAKKYNAPVILVKGASLSTEVANELKRLGVKNVFIVGGPAVISMNVENSLKNMSINVTRLAGADRYETSLKIAQQMGTTTKVALVSGDGFADAISVSAPAAIEGMPILLVNKNYVPNNISQYINSVKRDAVYIIGGSAVITDAVKNQYPNSKRLSGPNRVQTNIAVLNEFINDFNMSNVFIGTSLDFPDTLSGAAAASLLKSPVLLVDTGDITTSINYISPKVQSSVIYKILGGPGVIDASVEQRFALNKTRLVAIDPGHGGYDSGAVGPTKVKEKDVTLAVALKVGELLKAKGINVVYTRSSDTVTWSNDIGDDLQTRCDIANNAKADFFISIHCNAVGTPSVTGTETYYSYTMPKNVEIGKIIQKELIASIGLKDRGTKADNVLYKSGLYVLSNTDMTAVLTELGFITNPQEEKLLNSADFQTKCANGLANGIVSVLNYMNK